MSERSCGSGRLSFSTKGVFASEKKCDSGTFDADISLGRNTADIGRVLVGSWSVILTSPTVLWFP